MILSFGDSATEDLYHGRNTGRVRRFPHNVQRAALRKLDVLDAARELFELHSPPGNRLEALRGNWQGYYSIRVNDQWRIVFRWLDGDVDEVQIIDYH